jgi:hypothetical protein
MATLEEIPLEAPVPIGLTITVLLVMVEVVTPVPVGPTGGALVVPFP